MTRSSKKVESELLDNLFIAAPCSVSWDSMTGDDRARACSMCSRKVYNISDMTRKEANAFLEEHGISQCLSFYRRADGTIMTDDCPIALRKLRDRCKLVARMVAGAVACVLSTLGCYAQGKGSDITAKPDLSNVRFYGEPGHHQPLTFFDDSPIVKGGPQLVTPPLTTSTAKEKATPITPKFTRGVVATRGEAALHAVSSGPQKGNSAKGTNGNDESGNEGKDPYYKLKAVYNELADPTAYNLFLAGEKNFKEGKILVARAYFRASLKAFDPANCDWKLKQLVEEQLKRAEQATPSSTENEEEDAIMNIEFKDDKPQLLLTR